MNCSQIGVLALLATVGTSAGACVQAPTHNGRPSLHALTAVPDSIGSADSTTVTCIATDPDGDVLVFDWITDARLKMQGTRPYQYWLYNTHSPVRVFYPGAPTYPVVDTGWVQCIARDGRGMSASRTIYIKVHH